MSPEQEFASPRVFVSRSAGLTPAQEELERTWLAGLSALGFSSFVLQRPAYAPVPWAQLRSAVTGMDGALVLGFRHLNVERGEYRPETPEARPADGWFATPWSHIEAGMAVAAGLPLLVVPDQDVGEGIFEGDTWGDGVYGAPMDAWASAGPGAPAAVQPWASRVREDARANLARRHPS